MHFTRMPLLVNPKPISATELQPLTTTRKELCELIRRSNFEHWRESLSRSLTPKGYDKHHFPIICRQERMLDALERGTISAYVVDPIEDKAFEISTYAWTKSLEHDPFVTIHDCTFCISYDRLHRNRIESSLVHKPIFINLKECAKRLKVGRPSAVGLDAAAKKVIASFQLSYPGERRGIAYGFSE